MENPEVLWNNVTDSNLNITIQNLLAAATLLTGLQVVPTGEGHVIICDARSEK